MWLSKERTSEHDKSIGADDERVLVPSRSCFRFAEREMPRERARRKFYTHVLLIAALFGTERYAGARKDLFSPWGLRG